VRYGRLYFIGNDATKGTEIDLRGCGLDFALERRTIHPREVLAGWTFFELPHGVIIGNNLRFRIRDMAGKEYVQTAMVPRQAEGIQGGAMMLTGSTRDLTKTVKYQMKYSDFVSRRP
jgi:hypothetical protein